jgi:predicted ATPase
MIKEIRYKNFKALRDTTLPLGQFTLIVGANGTGKTTAMKALNILKNPKNNSWEELSSAGLDEREKVEIAFVNEDTIYPEIWTTNGYIDQNADDKVTRNLQEYYEGVAKEGLNTFQMYSFDSNKIAATVPVNNEKVLVSDGGNLAGILDLLKDSEPERFDALNNALTIWFPEYDKILFDRNDKGKFIVLRTKIGQHKIKAEDLSDGTRLALAYLTIAYLPNPPKIVCFEEPERGIHPKLLNNIQEAMYRLAFPANYGENREPIQVVATTHSPYLLDLYKDNPKEIVIAEKDENGVHFENLSKMKNIDKILQGGESLGEVWFTGILGGVPKGL